MVDSINAVEQVQRQQKAKKNLVPFYALSGASLASGIGHYVFNKKIDKDMVQWSADFKKLGATPELGTKLDKLKALSEKGGKAFKIVTAALTAASILALIFAPRKEK